MVFNSKLTLAFLFLTALALQSCKKDPIDEDFDRSAMLTNMASGLIKPSYNTLASDLASLNSSVETFVSSADIANLNLLKTEFQNAYKSFQHCKMYNFGPMSDYGIKASMNTYPTDTSQILSNITTGSYNLTSAENVDAIGFPALDFLLFYQGETNVINSFTVDLNANSRKTYLTELTTKMKSDFDLIVTNWAGYETGFIEANGTDAASSATLLFNEWVKDIELLKNAKIGIPAGQETGGATLPVYVEGYYSQISILLIQENISKLKSMFTGALGLGFDDYIRHVESEETVISLADNILSQFDICSQKIDAIGTPLSEKVDTNPSAVNEAWLELKKLVTYCKTDMSSSLGILITYQDSDGD
jgi:predicted lipoprotein